MNVEVRPATRFDLPFVYNSWLECYWRKSDFGKRIKARNFFPYHHRLLEETLKRHTCSVLIAAPAGDPDTIVGYLVVEHVGERTTIHFAYTKAAFRRLGVMKALLTFAKLIPNDCWFTHWTTDADRLTQKYPGATYCPYLL